MSDQASTTEKKSPTNRIREVAFAEIAVQRLRSRLPGSRNWSNSSRSRDEHAISVPDPEQQYSAQLVGNEFVDSESGTYTESEAGSKSRGRVDNNISDRSIKTSNAFGRPSKSPSPKTEGDNKIFQNFRGDDYEDTNAYECSYLNKAKAVTRAPEQAITLFAFRLAILEKAARGAGTLTFVWATVVLLGGFSSLVSTTDFWVVTCLLLTEGSRIFLLSNELQWQQASSRSSFSLYQFGSSLAHRSSRAVTGVILRSPGCSSSDERPTWNKHNGVVPDFGSPLSHVSSPAAPLAIQQSKRVHQIAAGLGSKKTRRTWSAAVLPLLPYTEIISAKGMATFLYLGQIISASVCLALSLWRLILNDFLDFTSVASSGASKNLQHNVIRSLYGFYVMAFLEAFIFLVEKTYWEYKIIHQRLFEKVDKEAELRGKCVETIRSFFYQVYSRSLAISVFTGFEMDLVSYSMELLQSDDGSDVLGASRILKTFVEGQHAFQGDTLRRLGIKPGVIDRLVEMLAWHHVDEKEIRLNSAAIIKALVSSTRNGSRVIAVSGSLENIMSLIQWDDVDKILHTEGTSDLATPLLQVNFLRNYGLDILKSLALDHVYCLRIGETRGLLAKLVDFIDINRDGRRTTNGTKTICQSLQLLNVLASTTGTSGSFLRPAIANVVSAIPNLRDILHSRVMKTSKDMHELAVDVLMHLALDKTSREVIGSTGGVISNLMLLFTRRSLHLMSFQHRSISHNDAYIKQAASKEEIKLALKSGKVLMRLALRSEENCNRILRVRFDEPGLRACTVLLGILQDEENEELGILAGAILRGTFMYMSHTMQREVSQRSELILKRAIVCDSRRVREALLGLATSLRFLSDEEFTNLFNEPQQRVDRNRLVDCLLVCLNHVPLTTRQPKTRRYALELIFILLTRDVEGFKPLFLSKDLPSTLMTMLDNISDVENYLLFSGGIGLTRHIQDMESLVLRVSKIFEVDCEPLV